MIENDQAVVEPDATIRQFEIIARAAGKFRFDKIFQVVAPIPETPSERKWKVQFIEQLKARHEAVEQAPRVAILNLRAIAGMNFASGTERAERKERVRCEKGVASGSRIALRAAQQNQACSAVECRRKRIRPMRTRYFFNQQMHANGKASRFIGEWHA